MNTLVDDQIFISRGQDHTHKTCAVICAFAFTFGFGNPDLSVQHHRKGLLEFPVGVDGDGEPISLDPMGSVVLSEGGRGSGVQIAPGGVYCLLS